MFGIVHSELGGIMRLSFFRNQILTRGLKLAALAAICGCLASADVLYWTDFQLPGMPGVNVIPGGIALAGFTGVAATSSADFDSKLTTGTWSAVIIAIQGNSVGSYNILPDLTTYVNNGGTLIGTDWDATDDSAFLSLFDAAPVGVNTTSVTNDGNALFNGITGNISLANPGWGVYDQSLSALAGGTGIGPSGSGFGIIEGNNGQTFLNGPLFDTYKDPSQGQQLVANELSGAAAFPTLRLNVDSVPEPGTFVLLLGAVGGLMLVRKLRRRAPSGRGSSSAA
jgi:hypothetical protein